MESVKEATGVDMKEIIRANSYDAKVNRKVELSGDALGIVHTDKTDNVNSEPVDN